MWDVIVVGGGNAALCSALMAREAGASVLILEASPKEWRGGNSQHTRNLRCMHDAPQDVLVDAYPEEEYWQDLLKVTGGQTNEKLARMVIRESSSCRDWMRKHGVHFQPPLSGTLHVARTNAFFMGGGKALVNAYYASAEKLGIDILYDSPVDDLEIKDGKFIAAKVGDKRYAGNACVLGCGGFESDRKWLREATSGTTPPYSPCMAACEKTSAAIKCRPRINAAALSSQEVSKARIKGAAGPFSASSS